MISIILPAYNEEPYIARTIGSLAAQKDVAEEVEIIVVDGMSEDRTVDVAREALEHLGAGGSVLSNPKRTVPYAVSVGLKRARGDKVVIGGAHAVYPDNYLSSLVAALRDPRVGAAGGVLTALPANPESPVSTAIADTMGSRLGVGLSHRTSYSAAGHEVSTVAFPMYRREVFDHIGGYDVTFPRAQDLEFHVRLRQAGWRILIVPEVAVGYIVRGTLRAEARMAFSYGYWKPIVNRKRRQLTSVQQLLPPALVIIMAAGVLSILLGLTGARFGGVLLLYPAGILVGATILSVQKGRPQSFLLHAISYAILHIFYGIGYISGFFRAFTVKRGRVDRRSYPQQKTILHLGKYFPPDVGGIETVTRDIVAATNESATPWRADVLCFSTDRKSGVTISNGGLVLRKGTITRAYSAPISLRYLLAARRLSRSYDVFHVHLPNPIAVLSLLFITTRPRVIAHWHSDVVRQTVARRLYYRLLRVVRSRVSCVLGATDAHINQSHVGMVLPGVPRRAIPYFLPDRSAGGWKEANGTDIRQSIKEVVSGNDRVVFSLGRMVFYKGFPYLIRAARYLSNDYRIVIGGDGPLLNQLRHLAAVWDGKVVLPGRLSQSEAEALFKRADVFCLPSINRAEMFGMVQLEAFRQGVPVVSTRIPGSGVSSVNDDGVTGMMVKPGDTVALARAIKGICEDDETGRNYGKNARTAFQQRYAQEAVIPDYIDLYNETFADKESVWA